MSWRDRLLPASFRGIEFHIEAATRSGGRRGMLHEFPKRDQPEWEDLGRRGRAFSVTAYLVGPEYRADREALKDALEQEDPGTFVHPTRGQEQVACVNFNETEVRSRGGYVEIDIQFVEAGTAMAVRVPENTQARVEATASAAEQTTATEVDRSLGGPSTGQVDV